MISYSHRIHRRQGIARLQSVRAIEQSCTGVPSGRMHHSTSPCTAKKPLLATFAAAMGLGQTEIPGKRTYVRNRHLPSGRRSRGL